MSMLPRIGLGAGIAWALTAAGATIAWAGDPPEDGVAGAPTDDAVELLVPVATSGVPRGTPGAEFGPRTSEPEPVPVEVGREWFGGLPWWQWSRMTGDWAGGRTWLEEHGITFEGSFTIEWADAISGGISRKWVDRNYLDLNVTFDTEKLFGLQGGTFYVEVASSDSTEGLNFVPGLMLTSNIEIEGSTFQVANMWYEQKFLDGALRAKFGKLDATTEFGYLDSSEGFLNLATLYPVTMTPVPTYPYSGLGGVLFAYPCENFYIGGGAFDASFVDDQFIRDDSFDDVWTAGETGITWDALGPVRNGRVAFGGWWDSREMARFDGNGNETTYGLYAVAEQRLWGPSDDKDDDHGFSIFGQWNYSNPEVNPAQIQYGLGLALHGTFPGRDDDRTGIYVGSLVYSAASDPAVDSNETAIELFYRAQVLPSLAITPDIQFILNPTDVSGQNDAIVFTLRAEMTF